MNYDVIAGKLNNGMVNFWDRADSFAIVGEYAVVENRDGYALVEVVAVLKIDAQSETFLKGLTNGCKLRKAIKSFKLEKGESDE